MEKINKLITVNKNYLKNFYISTQITYRFALFISNIILIKFSISFIVISFVPEEKSLNHKKVKYPKLNKILKD